MAMGRMDGPHSMRIAYSSRVVGCIVVVIVIICFVIYVVVVGAPRRWW